MSVAIAVSYLNLEKIADSGQCFRWEKVRENVFLIPAFGRRVLASNEKEDELILDCTEDEYETIWKRYFDLEEDYKRFFQAIDKNDAFLVNAGKSAKGVRILRQDLWEVIISFLISQNNNIPRIKQCIHALCEKFSGFPTSAQLAAADEEELKALKLGYRSSYLKETAILFECGKITEKELYKMDYKQAKACLMQCKGIGPKVADCTCLFGLHHIEAFPIDTWIRQAIEKEYCGNFPFERYEGFAGVIQQFIFYSYAGKHSSDTL